MRPTFHRLIFWLHFGTGIIAGLLILSLAVSGFCIAYERQITEWADHRFKARRPDSPRMPLQSLLSTVRQSRPDIAPHGITLKADPSAPVLLNLGREALLYVDPHDGAILGEGDKTWRAFFHWMTDWHRFLGQHDDARPIGKAITGAATLLFGCLLISGIYLWWPRHWRMPNLRAALLFNRQLVGRARDWNWHNVIGFWSAVPLLLIIVTGLIMSYAWANNLLFTLTGSPLPPAREAPRRPGGKSGAPPATIPSENIDALIQKAMQQEPRWQSISLRMMGKNAVFMIDQGHRGRPDLRTMLTLDARTTDVVSVEPFASNSLGRRLRMYARFLHTGELFGFIGQTLAALSACAASLLVWTGFSLAWRRFRKS